MTLAIYQRASALIQQNRPLKIITQTAMVGCAILATYGLCLATGLLFGSTSLEDRFIYIPVKVAIVGLLTISFLYFTWVLCIDPARKHLQHPVENDPLPTC